MSDQSQIKTAGPIPSVEKITELTTADLHDLCDATDAAIEAGGGFGWVRLPSRDILERYWKGVIAMPSRMLFVTRLDGVICGTAQLVEPPRNNEAQSFAVNLTTTFVAPWARGHGLGHMLLEKVEQTARDQDFAIINLDVRETQTAAIKLYESHGYQRFGTHPYYARVNDEIIKGLYYYKVINEDSIA